MSPLDTHTDDVGFGWRGLLEGIPFFIVERRFAMNKELLRRFAVLAFECFEYLGNQSFRFGCFEVELEVARRQFDSKLAAYDALGKELAALKVTADAWLAGKLR